MNRSIAALLILAATLAAAPAQKSAPKPVTKSPAAGGQVGQWNVQTSQMSANLASGQFSAPDHLTMTRSDGSVVQGDRAVGNFKQKLISLYGNVSVHDQSGNFGLQSGDAGQSKGPATLTSDQLSVNDTTHLFDAKGHVHYAQGDTVADSQTAHLNDATHQLTLTGDVHVVQGDRDLYAATGTYNTKSGAGIADTDVRIEFPGITPQIATPKPINIKGPKIP